MMAMGCGSRDANHFTAAVREDRLPPPSSLTYQGLFSQHWYHTGGPETERDISVAALAARAGSLAPTPGLAAAGRGGAAGAGDDVWVGCFLKAKKDGQPRDATPLDLVVVLDVSGSMNSTVGGGGFHFRPPSRAAGSGGSRLELARAALRGLLSKLRQDDGFALATFTTEGRVIQPLTCVRDLDRDALDASIDALRAGGGTTLAAGLEAAVQSRSGATGAGGKRHQRVLFLTDMDDAQPGALGKSIASQVKDEWYVSFVGISSGFKSELAEAVSKQTGCNYFCVTKDDELEKVVVTDFDWNFFPAAFGVEVAAQSGDFDIVGVYGTPHDDAKEEVLQAPWNPLTHRFYPPEFREQARTLLLCSRRLRLGLPMPALQRVLDFVSPAVRSIFDVDTAFPSGVADDGSVEGGLVLLRLRPRGPTSRAGRVRLTLRYRVDGQPPCSSCIDVDVPPPGDAATPKAALRRGVALQLFVETCRRLLEAFACRGAPPDEQAAERADTLLGVESLLADFEAAGAEFEALCPGLVAQLQNFAKMARAETERAAKAAQPAKGDALTMQLLLA